MLIIILVIMKPQLPCATMATGEEEGRLHAEYGRYILSRVLSILEGSVLQA
jgi:hypothetical protein